jgi:hypothetical protein
MAGNGSGINHVEFVFWDDAYLTEKPEVQRCEGLPAKPLAFDTSKFPFSFLFLRLQFWIKFLLG